MEEYKPKRFEIQNYLKESNAFAFGGTIVTEFYCSGGECVRDVYLQLNLILFGLTFVFLRYSTEERVCFDDERKVGKKWYRC